MNKNKLSLLCYELQGISDSLYESGMDREHEEINKIIESIYQLFKEDNKETGTTKQKKSGLENQKPLNTAAGLAETA